MIQLTEKETKKLCGYAEKLAKRYARKLSARITYDDLVSVGYEAIARASIRHEELASAGYEAIAKAAVKHEGRINLRYFWVAIRNAILREIQKLSSDKSWIVDAHDEHETVNIVETLADENQDIEDEVCLRTLAINVRRQIDKLPKAERDYAVAVLIEGCTTAEVAEKRNYSRQRVSQLKKVVTQKLKTWNTQNRSFTC